MARQVYERLLQRAEAILRSGWPTIVDAAFLQHAERTKFRNLAEALAAPFLIVACEAPLSVLQDRVAKRQEGGRDAPDADVAVLGNLAEIVEAVRGEERLRPATVDSSQPPALAQRWLEVGRR